jgi:hypothetical protein
MYKNCSLHIENKLTENDQAGRPQWRQMNWNISRILFVNIYSLFIESKDWTDIQQFVEHQNLTDVNINTFPYQGETWWIAGSMLTNTMNK